MTTRTVYQTDPAGHYVGDTVADESPLEPGAWLMPAGTVQQPPPEDWPEGMWPRWNGSRWDLVVRPVLPRADSAAAKLAAFLSENPDVLQLVQATGDAHG